MVHLRKRDQLREYVPMASTEAAGAIPQWTLGDRLRKAREYTGMDQKQFAEHSGISRGTVTNYERGHASKISRPMLAAWALATGVSLSWIETGSSDFTPPPGADNSEPIWGESFGADLLDFAEPADDSSYFDESYRVIRRIAGNVGTREDFRMLFEADSLSSLDQWARQRAWWLIGASGGRPSEWGLPLSAIRLYLSSTPLESENPEEEILEVLACTRRDSNPKPSDPKVRVLRMLQDSSREAA